MTKNPTIMRSSAPPIIPATTLPWFVPALGFFFSSPAGSVFFFGLMMGIAAVAAEVLYEAVDGVKPPPPLVGRLVPSDLPSSVLIDAVEVMVVGCDRRVDASGVSLRVNLKVDVFPGSRLWVEMLSFGVSIVNSVELLA